MAASGNKYQGYITVAIIITAEIIMVKDKYFGFIYIFFNDNVANLLGKVNAIRIIYKLIIKV